MRTTGMLLRRAEEEGWLFRAVKEPQIRIVKDLDVDGFDNYQGIDSRQEEADFLRAAGSLVQSVNGSNQQVCQKSPYYDLYVVALMTGLRRGELIGLSESDIDFEVGWIKVRRQWVPLIKDFTTPKNGTPRIVPFELKGLVELHLREAIRSTKQKQKTSPPRSGDLGAIFTTNAGHRINGDTPFRDHFRTILRQAGLSREITFHALRHRFCRKYYDAHNADLEITRIIMGHADKKTTKRYLHQTTDNVPPALPDDRKPRLVHSEREVRSEGGS